MKKHTSGGRLKPPVTGIAITNGGFVRSPATDIPRGVKGSVGKKILCNNPNSIHPSLFLLAFPHNTQQPPRTQHARTSPCAPNTFTHLAPTMLPSQNLLPRAHSHTPSPVPHRSRASSFSDVYMTSPDPSSHQCDAAGSVPRQLPQRFDGEPSRC